MIIVIYNFIIINIILNTKTGMRKKLKTIELIANSPQKAFYILHLEKITDGYLVTKESGGKGKVLNRESWFRETMDAAEKLFSKIVREKTNPARKSQRKYRPVNTNVNFL